MPLAAERMFFEPLANLPSGVHYRKLPTFRDARGAITEVHRVSQRLGNPSLQWLTCINDTNCLRGVHAHRVHEDLIVPVTGRTLIGLQDLRSGDPRSGPVAMIWLDADDPHELLVPPGVAHAFYSDKRSTLLLGASSEYDPTDEFGCRWSDPELRLNWPTDEPVVSERDAGAGSLTQLIASLNA